MRRDHLFVWLAFLAAIRAHLSPGCRVLDFGCSSGELLRLLWAGRPPWLEPVRPSLAVGLERPGMRDVLATAAASTPPDWPILFSEAPLDAFTGQFDVILSHEVIYLLEDLDATFRAAHDALRPGGAFCAATAMYAEHEYYRRWRLRITAEGIPTHDYSRDAYVRALEGGGFEPVAATPLRLTETMYACWRSEHPFEAGGWFESEADERRYFTEVGKLLLVALRRPSSSADHPGAPPLRAHP